MTAALPRYQRRLIFGLLLCAWAASHSIATTADDLGRVAGEYYQGDGLGLNWRLTVTREGTFGFKWTGCLGTYEERKGRVSFQAGYLRLLEDAVDGQPGRTTVLCAVPWDGRMYLVPEEELAGFCSLVNLGSEPRDKTHGMVYLRRGDERKPAGGMPKVPERWRAYLLEHAVRGKITKLLSRTRAWIDVGEGDGVLKGMTLKAEDMGKVMFSMVQVEEVESHRALVKCSFSDDELVVGQTVTARRECSSAPRNEDSGQPKPGSDNKK